RRAGPVPVALRAPVVRPLVAPRADLGGDLRLHQRLHRPPYQLPQRVLGRLLALAQQVRKRHPVLGHRVLLSQGRVTTLGKTHGGLRRQGPASTPPPGTLSGPVWFLGGVFFSTTEHPPSITRDCTVPPNTALFFPILNMACSALEVAGGENNGCGTDPSEPALRAFIKPVMDPASQLYAEIDGARVPAQGYRVASGPGCFSYTPPVDNLLRWFG